MMAAGRLQMADGSPWGWGGQESLARNQQSGCIWCLCRWAGVWNRILIASGGGRQCVRFAWMVLLNPVQCTA
jgi:hypothetical protein